MRRIDDDGLELRREIDFLHRNAARFLKHLQLAIITVELRRRHGDDVANRHLRTVVVFLARFRLAIDDNPTVFRVIAQLLHDESVIILRHPHRRHHADDLDVRIDEYVPSLATHFFVVEMVEYAAHRLDRSKDGRTTCVVATVLTNIARNIAMLHRLDVSVCTRQQFIATAYTRTIFDDLRGTVQIGSAILRNATLPIAARRLAIGILRAIQRLVQNARIAAIQLRTATNAAPIPQHIPIDKAIGDDTCAIAACRLAIGIFRAIDAQHKAPIHTRLNTRIATRFLLVRHDRFAV